MSQILTNDLPGGARFARPSARIGCTEGSDVAAIEREAFRMVGVLATFDLAGPSFVSSDGRLVSRATRAARPRPSVDLTRSAFDRAVVARVNA